MFSRDTLSLRVSGLNLYTILRSSVYNYDLPDFMMLHISFIYIRNKSRANTLSLMTPLIIGVGDEREPLYFNICLLSVTENHEYRGLLIPIDFTITKSPLCGALSSSLLDIYRMIWT